MLGEQFENTYWHEGGDVKASVKGHRGSRGPWIGSLQEGQRAREQAKAEYKTGDPPRLTPPEPGNLQGMLLSPHAGTQTSRDPLLKEGEYDAAARHALGYGEDRQWEKYDLDNPSPHSPTVVRGDPVAAYRAAVTFSGLPGRTISTEQAGEELGRLTDVVRDTDIPLSVLKSTPDRGNTFYTKGAQQQRGGKIYGGMYSPDNGNIEIAMAAPNSRHYEIDSLAHELGHKRDPRIREAVANPDPILEGVADATSDLWGRGAGLLESNRRDRTSLLNNVQSSGYSTNNPEWKNDTTRALYAASRVMVSEHGEGGRDAIPNRHALFHQATGRELTPGGYMPDTADATLAHSLVLGQMAEEHPVVRTLLSGRGLPPELNKAAQTARKRYREMTTPPGEHVTQPSLLKDPDLIREIETGINPQAKPPKRYQTS